MRSWSPWRAARVAASGFVLMVTEVLAGGHLAAEPQDPG